MDKWALKRKIEEYEDRITECNRDIEKLNGRILRIEQQDAKISKLKTNTEEYFSAKRNDCNLIYTTSNGCAVQSSLQKCIDIYSTSNQNSCTTNLDNIRYYIILNIEKLNSMIEALEGEISNCEAGIEACKREIAEIERREREEREEREKAEQNGESNS